ncbi:MAG: TrkA C-terminal domain-containing protein [Candidatus Omnitrophica bacterium]|nr:TrkA C-terminal domain-containing protein [Candidatus Omnitrophota bacterium]
MSLIIMILTVIASFLVVRIGAVAFMLTGLDQEIAIFQALSAFSGTGFTTRESELIAVHPQRRKIASALIVLGNVGIVTIIASLVNSMNSRLHTVIVLAVFSALMFVLFRLLSNRRLMEKFTEKVGRKIIKEGWIRPVSYEELLLHAEGYGVSQVSIEEGNPLLGKTLVGAELRKNDILVLSIEHGTQYIANPPADFKFGLKDRLVCFGKMDNIRRYAYPKEEI